VSVPVDAARLAVGTLTVVPVRPPREVGGRVAGLAMLLAPVAVVPLAVAAGLVVWAGDAVLAPPLLTAVLAVAALAVGSRALHLDGLADTADGLAVPGDVPRRLEVMRTGDVGPVGAATLVLVLVTQVAAIAGVTARYGGPEAALTVGLAVVVSRGCLAPACARGVPAARGEGLGSTVAGSVPVAVAALVVAVLAVAALLLDGGRGLGGVVAALLATAVVLLQARRRLGGVTGDVLGAVVEVALAAYLVAQVVDPSAAWSG
jgi:adenosylcobinamide-GDP ribazoletransferase